MDKRSYRHASRIGGAKFRGGAASALLLAAALQATLAVAPLAYIGPGAGLGMIGALFAVLAFILLALLGPILYPIRLIRRRLRNRAAEDASSSTETAVDNDAKPQ